MTENPTGADFDVAFNHDEYHRMTMGTLRRLQASGDAGAVAEITRRALEEYNKQD